MSFSPPRLTDEWIEFQSKTQLNGSLRMNFVMTGWTIAPNQNELFSELTVTVRLQSEALGMLKVMPVHRDSDLMGLHILVNNLPNLVPPSTTPVTPQESEQAETRIVHDRKRLGIRWMPRALLNRWQKNLRHCIVEVLSHQRGLQTPARARNHWKPVEMRMVVCSRENP